MIEEDNGNLKIHLVLKCH